MDKSLTKLTKQELLAKAATLRVKTTSSMRKADIIAALEKVSKAKSKPAKRATLKVKPATRATVKKPARKVMAKAKPATKVTTPDVSSKAVLQRPDKWAIDTSRKKFFIANEQDDYQAAQADKLPHAYGETRIVALSRNPGQLFIYWEIEDKSAKDALKALGGGADWANIRWVIRLFDVTGIHFDGKNCDRWIDINIGSYERNRYIDLDQRGLTYVAVIGIISSDFRFQPIAQSDIVQTACDKAAEGAEGEWAISDDDFARLYALSGGGTAIGSSRDDFGGVSPDSELGFGASEGMTKVVHG